MSGVRKERRGGGESRICDDEKAQLPEFAVLTLGCRRCQIRLFNGSTALQKSMYRVMNI